jgi:hypothetical protein
MKGVVFTEFLDFVAARHGEDMVDDIIEASALPSDVEVRKLYPDAELPSFKVAARTATRLVMDYRSPRRMGDLAEGLILGTAPKFGARVRVQKIALEDTDGEATRFVIDLD